MLWNIKVTKWQWGELKLIICDRSLQSEYVSVAERNISALKDITSPPLNEPTIITTESIVEALKNQASAFKERLVTSTYIGRKIKGVSWPHFQLFCIFSCCPKWTILSTRVNDRRLIANTDEDHWTCQNNRKTYVVEKKWHTFHLWDRFLILRGLILMIFLGGFWLAQMSKWALFLS